MSRQQASQWSFHTKAAPDVLITYQSVINTSFGYDFQQISQTSYIGKIC